MNEAVAARGPGVAVPEQVGTDMAVTQEMSGCSLLYDLTQHRLDVLDAAGGVRVRLWRLPDTPGGWDIRGAGALLEVDNPAGVKFHPQPGDEPDGTG